MASREAMRLRLSRFSVREVSLSVASEEDVSEACVEAVIKFEFRSAAALISPELFVEDAPSVFESIVPTSLAGNVLASPKSQILIAHSPLMRILEGFRSR